MIMHVTRLEPRLPTALVTEMEALVAAGWFRDRDTLLADALRRYLESHRPQLIERFVHEDVEWDCTGMTDSSQAAVCDAGPIIHLDEVRTVYGL